MKLIAAAVLLASCGFAQSYRVHTSAGVKELAIEDYVSGVVAGESGVLQSEEALKAMAVAARTYAAYTRRRHSREGFDFCDTTHCQRFVPSSPRASRAAHDTAGQLLWFEGKPAFSVYSRVCGGKTEDVSAVWPDVAAPYLISHPDPYCSRSWTWSGSFNEMQQALRQAGLAVPAALREISVVRRTASGRARTLSLNGQLLSASAFRFAIDRALGWNALRSEQYTIENSGGKALFRGSGEGHGVGLCQMGADHMGLAGRSYLEILAFYYPGTTTGIRPAELHWSRLSGDGITLYARLPGSERQVMLTAERVLAKWRNRLPYPPPTNISIYVYPDLDSFRNLTGEPGWVAGRITGSKIELQPSNVLISKGVLTSTVEHEIIHVLIESAARRDLPLWFREGLTEHLAGNAISKISTPETSENGIRQRERHEEANGAYLVSQARVEALVARYGETTVLGWVVRGLPAEAKNSTARIPSVNIR